MRSRSLRGSVFLLLVSIPVACGSDDDSSGKSGGDDFAKHAAASCQRQAEANCPQLSLCEEDLAVDHLVAKAFACDAQHSAWVECLGASAWKCTPSGGGTVVEAPAGCDGLEAEYDKCRPQCSYSGVVGSCSGDCQLGGKVVAEADCADGPVNCTCSSGAKAGTTFSITKCDQKQFYSALLEKCR